MIKLLKYIDDMIPYWFFRSIKRYFDYAIQGWNSYDFDHDYIDQDLLFKLKRVEKQLKKDASFVQYEKYVLKSLRVAIKILERLVDGRFESHSSAIDAKWGKLEMSTEPLNNGYSRLILKRPKAITEEEQERASDEAVTAYGKDEAHRKRYRELLYKVLSKYQDSWWS